MIFVYKSWKRAVQMFLSADGIIVFPSRREGCCTFFF